MTGANLVVSQAAQRNAAPRSCAAGGIKTRREIAALEKMEWMPPSHGMYKNRLR